MSDTSDVTLQEDGVITYSDESRCVFEILATRAPSGCGRTVRAKEVGLAFLTCPHGKEHSEECWEFMELAVKRTRLTQRPLCPYEVQDICETGKPPEVHPEVQVDGNEVTVCPQGMLPILMPVAADLKRTREMFVELQRVLYALMQVTNQEHTNNCGQSEAKMAVDVLEDILVDVYPTTWPPSSCGNGSRNDRWMFAVISR